MIYVLYTGIIFTTAICNVYLLIWHHCIYLYGGLWSKMSHILQSICLKTSFEKC